VRHLFRIVIVLAGFQLSPHPASGVELRSYQFTVDGSLPYAVSCGECGLPFLGARADIAGIFTVALDRDAGTGALLDLNDQLVNVFDLLLSPNGPVLSPADPAEWDVGIIPTWTPEYAPPLEGALSVDNDTIYLISDGMRVNAEGTSIRIVPSYTIAMQGDQASLSMEVPINDWFITVTEAPAIRIPGDFNGDGVADAADYVVWRSGLGTIYTQNDYQDWSANYGKNTATIGTLPTAGSLPSGVPEPATAMMLLMAILMNLSRRHVLCH
jgi:hypothetical protein